MAIESDEFERLRDALIRARAAGMKSLEYDGQRVEYKTDAEMAAAIRDLEARIARASSPRAAAVVFTTSKGL